MAIKSLVYMGDHAGGPIDYSVPIGDVSGQAFDTPPLPAPSRTRFGIRNYDDATGLEDRNADVVLEVVIDEAGRDATNAPAAPLAVTAEPSGTAGILVRWRFVAVSGKSLPDAFHVYATAGAVVNYAVAPAVLVTPMSGQADYWALVSGLTGGVAYTVGVRAAVGLVLGPPGEATATTQGIPPKDVTGLASVATFEEGYL